MYLTNADSTSHDYFSAYCDFKSLIRYAHGKKKLSTIFTFIWCDFYIDVSIHTWNFKNKLKVKTGARICLNFNIRTIDELVNGSSGKIIDFVKNRRGNVDAIIILFDQETTGELQRKKHKHMLCSKKHGTGTPILRHKLEYQGKSARGFGESCLVSVTQFPMSLSWASTSHKMQVKIFLCLFL